MILRTGVDLIEIDRIREVVARHGRRYLERIYTPAEIEQSGKRAESLAARFAAKEAVAKALGCGIGQVSWLEIEILNDDLGAPSLTLHRSAAEKAAQMGLTEWSLSLSHSQSHAIALVVAIGN
jgi:holo-[acyl-carrier protein] synthase